MLSQHSLCIIYSSIDYIHACTRKIEHLNEHPLAEHRGAEGRGVRATRPRNQVQALHQSPDKVQYDCALASNSEQNIDCNM